MSIYNKSICLVIYETSAGRRVQRCEAAGWLKLYPTLNHSTISLEEAHSTIFVKYPQHIRFADVNQLVRQWASALVGDRAF